VSGVPLVAGHDDLPMEHPDKVGKYDIEQFLGGGMSRVYRARDTVLGRRVALKLLTEAGASDAESKARFLQEARTASNISHENIIAIYDFGEDGGRPFLVMELLEGESLRSAMQNGRLGNFRRRMQIALQVARAVNFIHAKKIVHRDLKPENIYIDSAGKVKLMDFGIAKSEDVKLTRAGFTMGTPYYMAPEQVLGQNLSAQADVFAFGVLLYEMLTGVKAVAGDKVEDIFHRILYEPLNLAPLRALKLPPAVGELITHCTIKQPALRPQGLSTVCDEIDRILNPSLPAATAAVSKQEHPAFLEKLPPPLRSQGGLMLLAGVTAGAGVAVIYLILTLARVI
jgi:eukaryotic-like serine/threonine-protein kinase